MTRWASVRCVKSRRVATNGASGRLGVCQGGAIMRAAHATRTMRAIVGAVIGGHVDNRRWPKSPARLLAPRMARRGAKTARYTGATPANGARYEDTRVDRRTAFCGVARGSAADAAGAWYKRPDKHINTPEYRRYLPGGNGRDVLQRGHRPEQRGLRDAWRRCSDQHGDYHAFSRPVEKAWYLLTSCATEGDPLRG